MAIDRALSASAVARQLGIHRSTLKRWTDSGLIPVWFRDDNGRPIYSEATIAAHQRRKGELDAERGAA